MGNCFTIKYSISSKTRKEEIIFPIIPHFKCDLKNILIVDDMQDNCKILKEILTHKIININTNTTYSGLGAINLVQDDIKKHQLILMDINMSPLNGIDTVIRLREQGFGGIVLGVTGMVDEDSLLQAQKAGFNDVIAKPVNIDFLLSELKKYFNFQFSDY